MTRRFLAFFYILTTAGGFALINQFYLPTLENTSAEVKQDTFMLQLTPKEPRVVYGMLVNDDHLVIEDKIKRNERLGDILEQYNVPAKLIHQVSKLSRKIFDPRKIAANKKYTLICGQDSMTRAKAFVYEPNAIDYIIFRFGDSLTVDVMKREVVTVEKSISGIIRSNLSETIEE